jgi:hypothetical protein
LQDAANLSSGGAGNRTPCESPEKSVLSKQSGAKSDALVTSLFSDPDLSALVVAWSRLPEAIKAGILVLVRASGT